LDGANLLFHDLSPMVRVAQPHGAHSCRKRISYDTGIRGVRQIRKLDIEELSIGIERRPVARARHASSVLE
jgi:hypothetical protein